MSQLSHDKKSQAHNLIVNYIQENVSLVRIYYVSCLQFFISMALAEGCDTERLTELVQSKVQGAEAIRHHGKEMAFALPMDQVSQFPGN